MANTDEDWKKFLASTEEDDEEVETPGEDETEELDEENQDDSADSDEDEDDSADEDEDSEQDDDSKKVDDKKKPAADTYKPRLEQFLNEDGSSSLEKLETAYIESGKQAVKLNEQLKTEKEGAENVRKDYGALLDAIKAKPDIAKALFGEEGAKKLMSSQPSSKQTTAPQDPLLQHIEAQMNNASQREYDEFVGAHPEAVTDPEKARKIGTFMKTHGKVYRDEHNGEIPSMKDSLEAAYKYYGWDIEIKKKEDMATAVKKTAATRSSATAKRPATKKEASMGEQFFAKKLGVTLKK